MIVFNINNKNVPSQKQTSPTITTDMTFSFVMIGCLTYERRNLLFLFQVILFWIFCWRVIQFDVIWGFCYLLRSSWTWIWPVLACFHEDQPYLFKILFLWNPYDDTVSKRTFTALLRNCLHFLPKNQDRSTKLQETKVNFDS